MAKEFIRIFSVLMVSLIGNVGCVGDSEDDGSSDAPDTVAIESIEGSPDSFRLTWHKNSSGYSEVIYTADPNLPDDERGSRILTNNSTGNHSVLCYLASSYGNQQNFRCEGTGPSIFGQDEITTGLSLLSDTTYYIKVNTGFDLVHSPTFYTLRYSNSVLTIRAV